MRITRKDLKDYFLLEELIARNQEKLDEYVSKMPTAFAGKVYGSNAEFPFQPTGFVVGGFTNAEIQEQNVWEYKCREIEKQIRNDIDRLNSIKTEIDVLISGIESVEDKAILQYTIDGKTQQWIANKIGLDQSRVSRRIKKYLS